MEVKDDSDFTLEDYRQDRKLILSRANTMIDEFKQSHHSLEMKVKRQEMALEDMRQDSVNAERLEAIVREGTGQNLALTAKKAMLESEVMELREALEALQSRADDENNANAAPVVAPPVELVSLQREIEEQRRETAALTESQDKLNANLHASIAEVGDLKDKLLNLNRENCFLVERNQDLEASVAEIRRTLKRTVEEYEEARENVALLTSQLEEARKGEDPGLPPQGNSLFGEVEVSRQRLLKKYTDLCAAHHELNAAYMKKCSDFSKLGADRASMPRELGEIVSELRCVDDALIDSLERRIKELEEANTRLKSIAQEPVQIVAELGASELKFLQNLVSESRTKVTAMETELDQRSVALLATTHELRTARHQVATLQAEVLRLAAQLARLPEDQDTRNASVFVADPLNVLAEATALVVTQRADFPSSLALDNGAGGSDTVALPSAPKKVGEAGTSAPKKVGAAGPSALKKVVGDGRAAATADGGDAGVPKIGQRVTRIRFEEPDDDPSVDREQQNLGKPLEMSRAYTKLFIPPPDKTGAKK